MKVTFSGVGLHSGRPCRVSLSPAAPGTGVIFQRVDLPHRPSVVGTSQQVVGCERQTVVGEGPEATIGTVEHLLSALHGLGLWDARIEVFGPEIPILDGSSRPFVRALTDWKLPRRSPSPLRLQREVTLSLGSSHARACPADQLELLCTVEFPHPSVGRQQASWSGDSVQYVREIAPARTFCFSQEVELLRKNGLAAGGSLDNAVVFDGRGPLQPLRFADEPVRHKLLDALGDLFLLGRPLLARVELTRPSHGLLCQFVRKIAEDNGVNQRMPQNVSRQN